MTTNNASEALAQIEAVRTINENLREEVLDGVDRAKLAKLNADLGIALKLADVYATLEVADAVRANTATLEHGRHAARYTEDPRPLTLTERLEAGRAEGRI